MNQYKLCITDPDLMALVKKHEEEILNAAKIMEGIIIYATSEENARVEANNTYILMPVKVNNFSIDDSDDNLTNYTDVWLKNNLTSCELLITPTH
jgi:hypothetical protein